LRVAGEKTLRWWKTRFEREGVTYADIALRDGRETLDFEDFEGAAP
jgi:glyoxalase family protein